MAKLQRICIADILKSVTNAGLPQVPVDVSSEPPDHALRGDIDAESEPHWQSVSPSRRSSSRLRERRSRMDADASERTQRK
jgi:hypothetical protein